MPGREAVGLWELIERNRRQSAALVFIMGVLLVAVGGSIGFAIYPDASVALIGAGVAFVIWLSMTMVAFLAGDKAVLSLGGARAVSHKEYPVFWNVVEEMSIAGGLPMPQVYVVDDPAPNAFATGRKPENSAIAVTTGLLERLNRDELQGVVAHEMSHIRHHDVRYMTIIVIMFGTIVLLCDLFWRMTFYGGTGRRRSSGRKGGGHAIMIVVALVLAVLAPILARLLYFAVSRRREYLADAGACELTRYPPGLASALEKIAGYTGSQLAGANRATAHLYIANPLKTRERNYSALGSTHPPIDERIGILRAVAGGSPSLGGYQQAFSKVTGRRGTLVGKGAAAIGSTRKPPRITRGEKAGGEAEGAAKAAKEAERKEQFMRMTAAALLLTCTKCGHKQPVAKDHTEKMIECAACGNLINLPMGGFLTGLAVGSAVAKGAAGPKKGPAAAGAPRVSFDELMGEKGRPAPGASKSSDAQKEALKDRLRSQKTEGEEERSKTASSEDKEKEAAEGEGENPFGVSRMPDGTLVYPPEITCPKCEKAIEIPAGYKGAMVRCPHCGERFKTV